MAGQHILTGREEVTVVAPSTVANLNCGFDGLGCALQSPVERLVARRVPGAAGEVRIAAIHGAEGLPMEAGRNVAGAAAASLLRALAPSWGVELTMYKEVRPGSGLGSSAASAAAAVVAVDALAGAGLRQDELVPFALDGEVLASGARHADNVAPALMGGVVLCPPQGPPIPLPVPPGWHLAVLHPEVEIRTADARRVLPAEVPLGLAVDQARWLAAFVAACHRGDGVAAAFALEDLYIGPARSALLPAYDAVRAAAFAAGARAGGIAGSGPSTFWVAFDAATARAAGEAARAAVAAAGYRADLHLTVLADRGAHVVE
jgi:homoserine kinase